MIQVHGNMESAKAPTSTNATTSPDVMFLPSWRKENPYQDLLAAGIEAAGLRVGFSGYPRALLPLHTIIRRHPGLRVLHLHWIAPYVAPILWSGNPIKFAIRLCLMAFDIALVRLRGVRVIWTVHNRLSHESLDPSGEIAARRWLARLVHHLIFHSAEARDEVEHLLGMNLKKRSLVIPHGHYIGIYPDDPHREAGLREQFGIQDDDVVVLFFGAIRRYKGIGQLLNAFRQTTSDRLKLIIAGNPQEADLAAEIEAAAAADSRIRLNLGFVPDADVGPLYAISHIAVIPFEKTLTSGSAILALSQGKALLLPGKARVLGLSDTRGTLFFDNVNDLVSALSNACEIDLVAMGRINATVAQDLNWERIGRETVAVYRHGLTTSSMN